MASQSNEPSLIIEQFSWLIKTYLSAKWAGLIAGLVVMIMAIISLSTPGKQDYLTRISFGTQPKMVKSKFDEQYEVMRLMPVVPENFTVEQIMMWHSLDFISFIKKASHQKYQRLRDIGFHLDAFPDGWVLKTSGKEGEQKLHTSFHKKVSEILLKKLYREEKRVYLDLELLFAAQQKELAGIQKKRQVITAEQEQSVQLLKNVVDNILLTPDKGTVKKRNQEALSGIRPDDGMANVLLALTKKRETLSQTSTLLRQNLASYHRLMKRVSQANIDILALMHNADDALSFSFKLAIWIFLIALTVLTVPFLWAFITAIKRTIVS